MEPRSRKDIERDYVELAKKSLKDHVILEDVATSEREGWWVIGQPDSSCYRVQICVLKWGSLLVHGDIGPVLFGHFSDRRATREAVVRWIAKGGLDYVGEKANIGMGRRMCGREREVVLWQVAERIKDLMESCEGKIEALSATEQRRLIMWGEVKDMIEDDRDLHVIDEYIYSMTGDCEDVLDGEVLEPGVYWAYHLVRKLVELLDAKA